MERRDKQINDYRKGLKYEKRSYRVQCRFKGESDKFYCREGMVNGYTEKVVLELYLEKWVFARYRV